MIEFIETVSSAIEMLAVAIILVGIVHGGAGAAIQRVRGRDSDLYGFCKRKIGRALLLSLELLVAADIIRTVAVDPSLKSMAILGLLVLIRTFLSWSVSVEIEGRWPWQGGETSGRKEEDRG